MNFERIRYETTDDIARVTLLHDQSDMRLVKELAHVCRHLEDENPCSVVVFQGSNGQFNRGINFAEFKPDTPMDIHGFNKWKK